MEIDFNPIFMKYGIDKIYGLGQHFGQKRKILNKSNTWDTILGPIISNIQELIEEWK